MIQKTILRYLNILVNKCLAKISNINYIHIWYYHKSHLWLPKYVHENSNQNKKKENTNIWTMSNQVHKTIHTLFQMTSKKFAYSKKEMNCMKKNKIKASDHTLI